MAYKMLNFPKVGLGSIRGLMEQFDGGIMRVAVLDHLVLKARQQKTKIHHQLVG